MWRPVNDKNMPPWRHNDSTAHSGEPEKYPNEKYIHGSLMYGRITCTSRVLTGLETTSSNALGECSATGGVPLAVQGEWQLGPAAEAEEEQENEADGEDG